MEEKEELIQAWIGKNSEKIYAKMEKKFSFSWLAFFLADLYMLTRKMFVETIIYEIVAVILSAMIAVTINNDIIACLVVVIIRIGWGYAFYPLYKKSILRKIKKNEDKGLSYDEQLEIARKQGGDKVTVAVIVALIICVIVYMFSESVIMTAIKLYTNTINNTDYIDTANTSNTESTYSILTNQQKTIEYEDFVFKYDSSRWTESSKEISGIDKNLEYKNKSGYITFSKSEPLDLDISEFETNKDELSDALYYLWEGIYSEELKEYNVEISKGKELTEINNGIWMMSIKTETDVVDQDVYCILSEKTPLIINVISKDNDSNFIDEAERVIRNIEFK